MRSNPSLLQSVVDNLENFLLILNPDGTLASINKYALRIIGTNDCVGKFVWDLHLWGNPVSSAQIWAHGCEVARDGERYTFVDEVTFWSGKKIVVDFSLSPVRDESGQITLLLAEGQGFPVANSSGEIIAPAVPVPENRDWLLEIEDRFRLMVENIEDYAMFMVDLDGFIASWNRGAERLTGYSDIEAIGRHFSMLYLRDTLDREHALHELTMAHLHGRYEEEGVRVRKDGTRYDAQIVVWRIDDHEGKTVGYAKITRDVTALKKAQQREAQLFESENRFRLMVESIDDYAMFLVDTDGLIISWNRGAERLTGYSEGEALGQPFSILYPENEPREHMIYELTMARANGRYEEEGRRVRKDGSIYDAQIVVWPVEDKSGEVISFAKITRDITVRKAAERAVKDSEAKFRTMTDAMPQMVWSALPDGKQDYINQQWFSFIGADKAKLDSGGWFDFVHPEDKEFVTQAWQESLQEGIDFEAQFRLLHVSGIYRWTLGRALPVRNDHKKITRWMGTLTDIHEQKHAEATLQESARRKDEYLAMLAHELRNPLAPIRNSTQLLRRLGKAEATMIGGLEVIDRQVAHMSRLIDDLLDVARISRGKIELRRENFELGELVLQTAEDFKTGYENKQVDLVVEVPPRPLWLFADPTRIAQALGNLLHNALKFTDANGEVRISLADETQNGKTFGVVKVADTGIGIDPHLLEQLFEPFVQGNQDLARSKGGLGLGLALIKGFASLHGGSVQARSAGLGQGAEFIFRIPLATGQIPERQPSEIKPVAGPLNIVLIDDNRDMVETLAALLTLDGHEVHCAYDGTRGLQLIKSVQPNLVLCDIGLPGALDGYSVARKLREDAQMDNVFLVALSGYGQEKDRKQAFESGFDDHLLKPIDFKILSKMLSSADQAGKAGA